MGRYRALYTGAVCLAFRDMQLQAGALVELSEQEAAEAMAVGWVEPVDDARPAAQTPEARMRKRSTRRAHV